MYLAEGKTVTLFAGTREQFYDLLDWKAGSVAFLKHYKLSTTIEGAHMQRQFTIELRVDYADSEKNAAIKTTLQQCARRAFATANLLADNPKATQVAIWSDDFFSGHEEIALLEDVLGEVDETNPVDTSEQPSDELLGALKDGV